MPRYLDPKADVVFKKIFGERPHLLQHFLNAILPLSSDKQIVKLDYLPAEQVPQIPILKRSIVDVKCTDSQGRIFIVEMQMEWTLGFMQRMLFNSAQAYVKQLHGGEHYVSLFPVYGIGLINDTFDKSPEEWYHHYKIVNIQNPKKQLEGLELIFLELPKFQPSNQKEKRLQVLWIRFLSEIGEKTKTIDKELLATPEIKEACSLCEEAGYSEGELEAYGKYWDEVRKAKTLIVGSRLEGLIEGEAKGLIKGRAEGEVKGRAEGRTAGLVEGEVKGRTAGLIEGEVKGRHLEKIAIAKQLLISGFPLIGIANVTELPLHEIEELQESLFTKPKI